MEKYFLDVPVYRINSDTYYRNRDENIAKGIQESWKNLSPTEEQLKRNRVSREEHFYETYGPWKFNEIVAYIRLYFLGSQIRGEHFSAEGKRVSLGRKRVFKWQSSKLAAELQLWGEPSNEAIFEAIHEYLDRCQKELRRGRYIERQSLNALGPYVDWRAILANGIKEPKLK